MKRRALDLGLDSVDDGDFDAAVVSTSSFRAVRRDRVRVSVGDNFRWADEVFLVEQAAGDLGPLCAEGVRVDGAGWVDGGVAVAAHQQRGGDPRAQLCQELLSVGREDCLVGQERSGGR